MIKQSTIIKMHEIFEFIRDFTRANSYPPSVREICSGLNIKSTATVYYYLNLLEDNNYIRKAKSKNRAIEIIKKSTDLDADNTDVSTINIPLIGRIAAGEPILATENFEDIFKVSKNVFSPIDNLFMLNVTGESMINAGIMDKDIIVVKRQSTANNSQIIVAMINDEATVKRFYKESNYYRLHPENDNMSDIIVSEIEILGVVVGLIRQY